MSEEEKKSVEWLKKIVKINKRDNIANSCAEILLNLIEKLLRENKKLKETNYLTIYQQAVADNNGRWGDKIQDMIKELEEQDRKWTEELEEPYSNFKNVDRNLKRIKNQVDILEELLKGE